MTKHFFWGGKRALVALWALTSALLLTIGCTTDQADVNNPKTPVTPDEVVLPPTPLPVPTPTIPVVPPVLPVADWDTIDLIIRTDPADPHNERFLDDWRFSLFAIDDQARPTSPAYFGESGPDGTASIGLPAWMFDLPLVIRAINAVLPLTEEEEVNGNSTSNHDNEFGECRFFEIFIPPFCHDKAVWLLGPFEDALWRYYKKAAMRRGEAWNPSQVDCGTWLANLQLLILTDEVSDELNELSDSETMLFDDEALTHALQENQHLLVPTRPPICMAERRHNGGGMERGEIIEQEGEDFTVDNFSPPFGPIGPNPDEDPIIIDLGNGIVSDICDAPHWDDEELRVNGALFTPTVAYLLDDQDFMGTIHDQADIVTKMDVSVFNVRLGNGRELDADKYDDACALTSIIEFTNKDDDEQDVLTDTGVTFSNLFEDAINTTVYLTSDGDAVVDDNDYWAIFYRSTDSLKEAAVIAVELLGHRQEDFRDVLHMTFDPATDDLFLGLRADYELNEEEVDGERAFLAYTIHVWDGSTLDGRRAIRRNIANCYEAADVWARQFFVTKDFDVLEDECCIDNDECEVKRVIKPLVAAEFAVRSQCFSNSRANQRWRTDDSGLWSMNSEHGVHGNVIVNPGWLAPDLDFEIYIQKFDEAVFKGPRTIRRTDDCGQLMAELPTLVEGDRVLIKAEDNCCSDYDLVIPCVPEFTGFAGAPGIPYVPIVVGPPPVVPVPVPVPVGPAVPVAGPAVPVAGPAVPVAGPAVPVAGPVTH